MNISTHEAHGPLLVSNEAGRQDPTRSRVQPESSLVGCVVPSGRHSVPTLQFRRWSDNTDDYQDQGAAAGDYRRTSSRYVIFSNNFNPFSEYSSNVGSVFSPPSLGLRPDLISATISDWAVSTRMSMILVCTVMVVYGVELALVVKTSSSKSRVTRHCAAWLARYLYYGRSHT